MDAPTLLLLKNLNTSQRTGLAVALILVVIVIFLQNPIDGYTTEISRDRFEEVIHPKCTQQEVAKGKQLQMKGRWPINEWHQRSDFEPLPEGIESWPIIKQIDWQYSTYLIPGNEIINRCLDIRQHPFNEPLPFGEWRSDNPIVPWFGSVLHLIGAIIAISLAGLIWLVVFQSKQSGQRNDGLR
jgi:hypothetical protein